MRIARREELGLAASSRNDSEAKMAGVARSREEPAAGRSSVLNAAFPLESRTTKTVSRNRLSFAKSLSRYIKRVSSCLAQALLFGIAG